MEACIVKLSKRQREVLIILRDTGADCWGAVWSDYDGHDALDFRNFDRVCDALVRKGFVTEEPLTITDAGRNALSFKRL
jgi:hypothetical protein